MKNFKLFDKADKVDFQMEDLKNISNRNIKDAKDFLIHSIGKDPDDLENFKFDSNLDVENLREIILDPTKEVKVDNPLKDPSFYRLARSSIFSAHKKDKLYGIFKNVEKQKQEEINKDVLLSKKQEEISLFRKKNIYFLDSINDGEIETKLVNSDIRCVMLVSDTLHTRNTKLYKDIVKILNKNQLPFVEYTNVQPDLDRSLVFKMSEFAHDHNVNTMFVIGSMSTIDLMRIVLPKIIKPNILSLHQKKQWDKNLASQYYIFSLPTFVTIEEKVNSRSALKNNVLFPESNFLGDTIFLNSVKNESDFLFFYGGVFNFLSREKTIEVLHETFFRLIMNYFDLSLSNEVLGSLVKNMETVLSYLEILHAGQRLGDFERDELVRIISSTIDGRAVVDVDDFWIWYKLESSLSLLVNSKRSDGLALFLPVYLEVLSDHSPEFANRAVDLGTRLFGSYSVDGLILKIMLHIKKYKLPESFLDIPQINKVDWRFLMKLVKKSSSWTLFSRLTKTIIKNLTIW